jgi:hypothetical protein
MQKTAGLCKLLIKIIIRLLPIKSDGVESRTNRFILLLFKKWDKVPWLFETISIIIDIQE